VSAARPLVSVVLPTYNREGFLQKAAESVLAQTYDHWELLVVDDGSTDATRTFLGTLRDPRIRPVFQGHSGIPAQVRNAGARTARGDYLAFLDSDDQWLREKLALQIEDLHAHPDSGWSYTGFEYLGVEGRGPIAPHDWAAYNGWILELVIDTRALIVLPSVVVHRRLFERVGGFDESLPRCEDYDLWIKLAEASPARVVSTPLVKVRQHPEDRQWTWLDMLEYMNRIYDALLARTTSPRIRRRCRAQKTRLSLDLMARMRSAGQYGQARQGLRTSFAYAGWHPGWWTAVLKTGLRPAIPATVLALYYRLKG